jgi:hypothetical protein
MRGAEHDSNGTGTQMAISNNQHQPVVEVGLGQVLLKCAPAPISEQKKQGLPVWPKEFQVMMRKSVEEQGQIEENGQWQHQLRARTEFKAPQPEPAKSVAMQHVTEQNQSEEYNPNARVGVLPMPDVNKNCSENHRHFNCRGNGEWASRSNPVIHYSH